ncbi:cell division protein FtsB [Sedimentibacter acidaminivorans]|uniref:Cell division protein FtsB n=1 Tax=Sedimentibacter acidaminivorans TaxID=913099 RepID=A0ABS4G957_9FIRM|nr:septum formation initiator family protein [Sedimentibacter acidaminivorans]MBP1924220.1 cell division protein FtsB [Sedimentibacter acidaminivorans]
MNEDQKIIELKNRISNDDFRRREMEIKQNKRRNKRETPKKKKNKLNVFNLFFVIFVLYFAYTAFNQTQMINNLDVQIAQKTLEKSDAEKEANKLKQDVEKISNDDALLDLIEEVARDQYKMVKPNEIIYIDKNKNDNKFIKGIGFDDETTGDDIINN